MEQPIPALKKGMSVFTLAYIGGLLRQKQIAILAEALLPYLLTTLFFVLPLSSTAKSICLVFTVLTILCSKSKRSELLRIFSNDWAKVCLCLVALVILGCFWSGASFQEKGFVLEKYSKFLYLPLLVVGFQTKRTRQWALHGFLFSMFITCSLSLYYLHYHPSLDYSSDALFRNHIMTGMMVAFAAYLSVFLLLRHSAWQRRFLYGCMAILFSYYVFFINSGRTGYVIYLLLLFLFILQIGSFRTFSLLLGLGFVTLVSILSFYQSPIMHERLNSILSDIQHYQQNEKDTSIGFRLQFHDFARKLFYQHPLRGNGTGSFTYLFRSEKPVPGWKKRLLEPHSQYWLMAAELGIFGLVGLVFLFILLLKASLQLTYMRSIAIGTLALFALGNLTDSLLFYSGSGYFFIFMMALCLGEEIEKRSLNSSALIK